MLKITKVLIRKMQIEVLLGRHICHKIFIKQQIWFDRLTMTDHPEPAYRTGRLVEGYACQ